MTTRWVGEGLIPWGAEDPIMATLVIESTLLVLAVSVLVGGLAIHLGATVALASKDYTHAVVTAVLGALGWVIVDTLFRSIAVAPALSSLIGLVVWIGVIGWRYGTGWLRAGLIGLFAWLVAIATLSVLHAVGVSGLSAYGVPGV